MDNSNKAILNAKLYLKQLFPKKKWKSIHWVGWVRIRRDAEHIVFPTAMCFGYLHGLPLQCIGGHEIAELVGRGTIQVGGAVGRKHQKHG